MNIENTDLNPTDVRFDPQTGLVPAVIQDSRSGRVLMLGYMTRQALDRTIERGRVTFFSRERGKLWEKGETSGNWLELREVRLDCDGDALLVRAEPHGPTCHTGAVSCFGDLRTETLGEVLGELQAVISERDRERPGDSYTARLLEAGRTAIARKVAEEATELALDAATDGERVADEAADLLYHTLVLLTALGRSTSEVAAILRTRRR